VRDLHFISQDKFEDPMRKLIKEDEQKKIYASTKLSKFHKKCKYPTIPNRFGIEAGHLWDGVDRSNGYEKRYLENVNHRQDQRLMKEMEHLKDL
jgi:pre-mRNA-splicing factor CWC26